MNFKEVTAEDLFGKGVTGLPDTPGLSTTDMQAKFDELVKDVMVPKFNALVRELAVLSGVESVTKELENTETSIPTGSAVAKYIEEKGSGNATVEEMTWAEYEALSEEEKMDGTLRVITDRKAGVRFGNVDISDIGDGTVTGAIATLNAKTSEILVERISTEQTVKQIDVCKKNGICTVTYADDFKPISSGNLGVLCVLPNECIPMFSMVAMAAPDNEIQIKINDLGEISAYNYGNAHTSNFACRFSLIYPTMQ